jgi:hypothetical protein
MGVALFDATAMPKKQLGPALKIKVDKTAFSRYVAGQQQSEG